MAAVHRYAMVIMQNRLVVLLLLLVVGALAGFGVFRYLHRQGTIVTAPIVWEIARQAQKQAAAFKTTPLGDLTQANALTDSLLAALPADIPGDASADAVAGQSANVRQVMALIVDFLRVRSQGDPQAYAQWAQDHGKHLAKSFADVQPPGVKYPAIYAAIKRVPEPKDISPAKLFDAMFKDNSRGNDGALRPVAVISQSPVVEIGFARVHSFQDIVSLTAIDQMRPDSLGFDFWVGGVSQFATKLWRHDRTLAQIAQRDRDGALAARVRLAVEGASGLRVPMFFVVVRDDVSQTWRIEDIWINNVGSDPKHKLLRTPYLYVF